MSHPGLRDCPVFINWSIHSSRTQQWVAHAVGEPPQDPDAAGRLRLPDTSAEKPQKFGAAKLPYRQYERIDAGMESWLMECVQNCVHISDRLIKEKGLSIAADLNQLQREQGEKPVKYQCGTKWLRTFKARYGIVNGQATRIGEAADARPAAPVLHPATLMPAQLHMYHAQLRTRGDATSPVGTTESEEAWDDDDDFSDEEEDAPMGNLNPPALHPTRQSILQQHQSASKGLTPAMDQAPTNVNVSSLARFGLPRAAHGFPESLSRLFDHSSGAHFPNTIPHSSVASQDKYAPHASRGRAM